MRVDPHPHRGHQPARVEPLLRGEQAEPERDEAEQQRSLDPEVESDPEGERGDERDGRRATAPGETASTRARRAPRSRAATTAYTPPAPAHLSASPKATDASQLCTTHGSPVAVNVYGSLRGMCQSPTMIRPVARWVRKLLSSSGRSPAKNPAATTTIPATNASDGARFIVLAALSVNCPRRLRPERRGARQNWFVDVDDRRAEHDDEQRREDAEHHRDEHLHRRLLRLLLGQLAALDPHLVGLGPQHPADRHAERVGLEDGEHERAHLGHVGALVEGPHGVGPAGAGPDLAEHAGELLGQRARARRPPCGRAPARSRGRPRR